MAILRWASYYEASATSEIIMASNESYRGGQPFYIGAGLADIERTEIH